MAVRPGRARSKKDMDIIVEPIKGEVWSHASFLLDRTVECMCGQRIETMDVCDLYHIISLIKQVTDQTRDADEEEISDFNIAFHVTQLTEAVVGVPSHKMTEVDMEMAISEVRIAVAAKLVALEAV
jgi:hypothetical protein